MKKKLLCIFLTIIILNGYSVTGFAAYENTHVNTGNQAEDLLAVAMTQSGYMEGSLEGTVQGSNNYTKYGVWWTDATNWGVDYSHSAWCSMFVSWCAWQADIPASVLYRTAGCDEGVKKAKERNTWHFSPANGGNYTPKRGDLIYFGTLSDSNHVGIVRSVSGTKVYTIEGNAINRVRKRVYPLGTSAIAGYGRPNYDAPAAVAETDGSHPVMKGSQIGGWWLTYALGINPDKLINFDKKTLRVETSKAVFNKMDYKYPYL